MRVVGAIFLAVLLISGRSVRAQTGSHSAGTASAADATPPKIADPSIHRLVLKDGSYQAVNKYEIVHAAGGDRVRYISSERGGDWEEIPIGLIDWAATRTYARQHTGNGPRDADNNSALSETAEIDAEEKADRNRDLEVAPHLRLPDETGIWALDTFHNGQELAELRQSSGDVNQQTGHNITRSPVNDQQVTKQTITINDRHAKVALHEADPVFFVSIDDDKPVEPGASAITVDTHGAGSQKGPESGSAATSRYVILHADVRKDFRFVGEVKLVPSHLVTETHAQMLEGKRWMKLTPVDPLSPGDYVLMEILSPREVNLAVWDFRIDPNAPDNDNAVLPMQRSIP